MGEKEKEALKALKALYLELPEAVAADVETKILAAFDEIKSSKSTK